MVSLPTSQKRKIILSIAILLITVGVIYSNSFYSGFHYDDQVNIALNGKIYMMEFSWPYIKQSFFAGGRRGDIYHPVLYRPVAMFSFALNYFFNGQMSFGYHVVNVTIHLLATLFLFLFIRQTLLLPSLKDEYGKHSILIAFLATAFWATNPLQLQGVTYIVQRMTSMAALFSILAMWLWLKFRISNAKLQGYLALTGAIIATFLAIGAKENALMLPFCILLYDLFFIQGITKQSVKRAGFIVGGFAVAAFFITWALSGLSTFSFNQLSVGYGRREFTLIQRLLTEPRVFFFYLSLLFYPMSWRLCLIHDMPYSHAINEPITTIIALIVFFEIMAVCIWQAKKWPLLSFCILYFFLNHLIEGSIFPLELIYEHRNYLPATLLFVPVAILLIKAWHWCSNKKVQYAIAGCAFFLIMNQCYVTYQQNEIWKSEKTLWLHNLEVNPMPRAFFNLASTYYREGDWESMAINWQKVIDFNKTYGTHYNTSAEILPYGKVWHRAFNNLRLLSFMNKLGGKEAMKSFLKFRKRKGAPGHKMHGFAFNEEITTNGN